MHAFLSGVRSVLNTLAVFALVASVAIGTIIGSLIALCWFEERLLGGRPRPVPDRRLGVEPEPAETTPERVAVLRPEPEQRVPAQAAAEPQPGVLKSAKSNPGETTQVASDSTVAEATARCHVPAGTRT